MTDGSDHPVIGRREAMLAAARQPTRALRYPPEPVRRAELISLARDVGTQPSVFISYSRDDVAIVCSLVEHLRKGGVLVNWDQDFGGGVDFAQKIRDSIDVARVVIVVWSPTSVLSRYVRDEARRALDASKLITTHVPGFKFADVPIGFGCLNAIPVDDQEKVRRSLAENGMTLRP